MEKILKSIENSLLNNNWYSALVISLILPDICGKLENNDKDSNKRYPEWFNKYLGEKYKDFLSGNDCYALRCSFLHEGSSNIEKQKAKDALDHFIFTSGSSHCNKYGYCDFGDSKYDGKDILQLSVNIFCMDMIEGVQKWLKVVEGEKNIQKNIADLLKIHENGFSIGNTILIK